MGVAVVDKVLCYLTAMAIKYKEAPGSRLSIAAIASSIEAILVEISRVEGEGKILL
jgi:hypothetical protein